MNPSFYYRDYVATAYARAPIWQTNQFWQQALQITPALVWDTIRDAFLELLLLIVFLVLTFKISQGRDIIVGFFEPSGIYGPWRLVFTTLAVMLYSVSMWIIPAFLFEYRDRVNRPRILAGATVPVFSKHLFFVHRTLSMLPFWGFAISIFHGWEFPAVILLFGLGQMALLFYLFDPNFLLHRSRVRKIVFLAFGLAAVVLCGYLAVFYQKEYVRVKVAYAALLMSVSFLLHGFYFWSDWKIMNTHMQLSGQSVLNKHKFNFRLFSLMAVLHVVCICLLAIGGNFLRIAPESLLLFIFSFYVFLIDLIYYVINVNHKIKVAFFIGLITVGAVYLFTKVHFNYRHFEIDYLTRNDRVFKNDLAGIETYYDEWKKRIVDRSDKTKPFPIILVSGEGGGSRAGLWFSQTLMNLDVKTGGKFKNHIFSLSTVSGSSVGLGAMLSFWKYIQEGNRPVHPNWVNYPEEVFKNNFTSGCVFGWTATDMWKAAIPFVKWTRDRNSELQDEEAESIQRSLFKIVDGRSSDNPKLYKRVDTALKNATGWYLNRDILSFYYSKGTDDSVRINAGMPLAFINTCRSSDARRGIFAPVLLDSTDFLDAIDVCRFVYADPFHYKNSPMYYKGRRKALKLGSAVNTSENFPFLSAPALIDSLGYFVDGGYHENSGLKTTLEIHEKLLSLLHADGFVKGKDYNVYVLYIKNGEYQKKYYPGAIEPEIPGLQPISALTNTPFSGSASYFEERARHILKDSFFIQYQLDYKYLLDSSFVNGKDENSMRVNCEIMNDIKSTEGTEEKVNYPLARWLSCTIIKRMRSTAWETYNKDTSSALHRIVDIIKSENKNEYGDGNVNDKKRS
jgi:hypothetical protein